MNETVGRPVMKIVAVAKSKKKGTRKTVMPEVTVQVDHGVVGDAHAGKWHRQISLLAKESIDSARARGLDVSYGDFGENVVTEGVDLLNIGVGGKLALGEDVLVEITQIGKVCHTRCAIFYKTGDCIMPREGVFARVLAGGTLREGDAVVVLDNAPGEKDSKKLAFGHAHV